MSTKKELAGKGYNISENANEETKLKQQESKNSREISAKWLTFNLYFRIPFGILVGTLISYGELAVAKYEHGLDGTAYGICILIQLLITAFSLATMFLGVARKKLGYYFLITSFFMESIIAPFGSKIDKGALLLAIAVFLLIWTLPNYIYMRKRKHLFGIERRHEAEK